MNSNERGNYLAWLRQLDADTFANEYQRSLLTLEEFDRRMGELDRCTFAQEVEAGCGEHLANEIQRWLKSEDNR